MSKTDFRNWFYILIFASTVSLSTYVILDLEFPRFGLIRIDDVDKSLVELQRKMELRSVVKFNQNF